MARRRGQWRAYQNRLDPSRLVFIDETWTKTNMTPLRGWAPRGQRLPAKVPQGRWKTLTFIAALRHNRVAAPWLIEGPINGESFLLYIEKVLVPTLKPGDIVIMDNLGSHRGKLVRAAIRAVGAKLFSCPNIPRISIPSRCSSPSSSTGCERQHGAQARPSTTQLQPFFPTFHPPNATTSSATPGMGRLKIIML